MNTSVGNNEGATCPLVVSSLDEVRAMVRHIEDAGEFVFDVETRGIVSRHADISEVVEKEWKEHVKSLKSVNDGVLQRSKESIHDRYRKMLALDPLRNEVFWIGFAVGGKSWAIPMGHTRGEILVPGEVGDGTTIPPPGYRKLLKNGNESLAKSRYEIPPEFSPAPEQLSRSDVFEVIKPLFGNPDILKVNQNVKFDVRSLRKYLDGEMPVGPFMDTMILQFVLNENLFDYDLESLITNNFSGHRAYAKEGKIGATIDSAPFSTAARYLHLDVRWTWLLYKKLYNKIKSFPSLLRALTLDMDALEVIMHMEDAGIPVDHRQMIRLGKTLDARKQELLIGIGGHAFLGFNPDSVADKKKLLFSGKRDGGLGLKPVSFTEKGSPQVDSATLEALEKKHPVVPMLLEWAEVTKLKSTYVDGLLPKLRNGRLHPSFNLHRAKTYRLSSSNPNLQNQPRESQVRSLFVAVTGEKLIVADYDQIELRVMCMLSHDPKMSRYFLDGIDIHTGAAASIFTKNSSEVTSEERQSGKMVNFLTSFGGGKQKLAASTGVSEDQAESFIREYYRQFSVLASWKEDVKARARKQGYVETLGGHRRRLPDILHSDSGRRSQAERQAVNAVVQGTAADICKEAMVRVHAAFLGSQAKLLVQVHDELLSSSPEDEAEHFLEVKCGAMGHGSAIEGIPLLVSAHTGYTWAEAK